LNPYTVFQPGAFQTFLQILVPGVVGGAPWAVLGYALFDEKQSLVCTGLNLPQTVGALLLTIIPAVLFGAVFFELGTVWEAKVLERKKDASFETRWDTYLLSRRDDERIAHGYVAYLAAWLKFELSISVALAFFFVGLWLNVFFGHQTFLSAWFGMLALGSFILCILFGSIARATHGVLDDIRKLIVEAHDGGGTLTPQLGKATIELPLKVEVTTTAEARMVQEEDES